MGNTLLTQISYINCKIHAFKYVKYKKTYLSLFDIFSSPKDCYAYSNSGLDDIEIQFDLEYRS